MSVAAAKTKAQKIIDENSVVVFSKSYCPYCRASKSLLAELGAKPYVLELDQVGMFFSILSLWCRWRLISGIEDGQDIQNALQELTNQRTVPNIFINKKHIGGNSDLQAIRGELPNLLKEAGAI